MSERGTSLEPVPDRAWDLAASALEAEGLDSAKCPNCGAILIGRYCAVCGQERDTHRRSLKILMHDFLEDIASLDSRVLRTAKALFAQPGELPSAFREGRTQRYVPAVRLYFFVSLVFFLILSITDIAIMQLQVEVHQTGTVRYSPDGTMTVKAGPDAKINKDLVEQAKKSGIVIDTKNKGNDNDATVTVKPYFFLPVGAVHSSLPEGARKVLNRMTESAQKDEAGSFGAKMFAGFQHVSNDPAVLNKPLSDWIPRVLFILMPVYAGLLALFYFREHKRYFFVDHLILSLNLHSAGFVLMLFAAAVAQFLPGEILLVGLGLLGGIYFLLAMKRFYGESWPWTVTKFFCVNFVYICFFVLPALGVVILLSLTET